MADVTVVSEIKYRITKMVDGKEKRQHFVKEKHRMTDVDEADVPVYAGIVGLILSNDLPMFPEM